MRNSPILKHMVNSYYLPTRKSSFTIINKINRTGSKNIWMRNICTAEETVIYHLKLDLCVWKMSCSIAYPFIILTTLLILWIVSVKYYLTFHHLLFPYAIDSRLSHLSYRLLIVTSGTLSLFFRINYCLVFFSRKSRTHTIGW